MQLKARRAIAAPIRPFQAWRERETRDCLADATAKLTTMGLTPELVEHSLIPVRKALAPDRASLEAWLGAREAKETKTGR